MWKDKFAQGKKECSNISIKHCPNSTSLLTKSNCSSQAYCWGDSEYNQTVVPGVCRNVGPALAGVQCNYDRDCGELPAYCDHDQNWQSLSPGQFHTCGILVSGVGYCWGDNTYGQSDVPSDTQVRWLLSMLLLFFAYPNDISSHVCSGGEKSLQATTTHVVSLRVAKDGAGDQMCTVRLTSQQKSLCGAQFLLVAFTHAASQMRVPSGAGVARRMGQHRPRPSHLAAAHGIQSPRASFTHAPLTTPAKGSAGGVTSMACLMCPMQQSGDSDCRQLWNLARICSILKNQDPI
jgi:hypothetical protein